MFTGVFFDNILVFSKTLEEHKEHLKKVFEELKTNKLFINGKKSEFFLQEIQYLGHIISNKGVQMDNNKLKVIQKWPKPQNLHELRSFAGLCSYYQRFIQGFATLARPLHELTKKKVKFQWKLKEDNAFKAMKEKFVTKPNLIILDLMKPFEVQCDACGESLGAVLLQEGHPIAYQIRGLKPQQQVLGIYEKE